MKKQKYFICILLIFISLSMRAQVIYVDKNNSTGIETGTVDHPFNTIKEGIEAAVPGNTVFIKEGNYLPDESMGEDNNVLYLKAGVKLLGEGADKSIINGIIVDKSVSNLAIGLEKLRFNTFSFARQTIAGPFTEQNIIKDCKADMIGLSHGKGIPVNDTTPGPIYGFIIENNDLGEGSIEFKQGAGHAENRISGNSAGYIHLKSGSGFTYFINNNKIQFGIADRSGACNTTISNNQIYNGVIIDKSGGTTYGVEDEIIENNMITCSETSPLLVEEADYAAAIIARGRGVTIRNNQITATGHVSGINAACGSPFNVINNHILIDEVFTVPPDVDNATGGIMSKSGYGKVTGNNIQGGYIGYYSEAGTTEFANNEIRKSYTGFYSHGKEMVHHNTIEACHGDGMILNGLRGPISNNIVSNNAGAGIRVLKSDIDLGGGKDNSPGLNVITGNGNFDLYIEDVNIQFPVLYARYNVWDHTEIPEILLYDIRDGSDLTGLSRVDLTPVGYLGINHDLSNHQLEIFPNPGNGRFNLRRPAGLQLNSLSIVNYSGQTVRIFDVSGQDSGFSFELSDLPTGIYLLRCTTSKGLVCRKLVKR